MMLQYYFNACFKAVLVFVFCIFSFIANAQEICNNNIDDDGDGLIDCYDFECAHQGNCMDFFYGYEPIPCQIKPPVGPFGLVEVWRSTVQVSTRSVALVADIDNDGMPEVIAHSQNANQLYVLDGATGATKITITCPAINDLSNALAVADVDGDGFAEIFAVANNSNMYCFDHLGNAKAGYTPPNIGMSEASPNFADFNGDGIPEIYYGNVIYNALTGALIANGGAANSRGKNPNAATFHSIAADVLPDAFCADCSGLELVCGNVVYAVNIAAGTLTAQPNSLPASVRDGFTAVADMNMDGQLDVIVTFNGNIYVWDPRTGLQLGNTFNIPNTGTGGRPNIADYDNDGFPEIGAGGQHRYVAIDFNIATNTLSQMWINTIVDNSQMTTGTTFDFEGDGINEVVYRDENVLYVYDGTTGAVKASIQCGSGTRTEFPTIADVNNDGKVNIICNCSANNQGSTGYVRVYASDNNRWIGARKMMNQHGYHVTNIHDDLTVPRIPQNHARIPEINAFLNQAPLYDENWKPIFVPAADLIVSVDTVVHCLAANSFDITISVCNQGSAPVDAATPVTFYNGNPLTGGTLINTQNITSFPIDVNTCVTQTFTLPWNNNPFNLFVAANDKGTNPAGAPELLHIECDSLNNITNINITPIIITPVITGLSPAYCPDDINVALTVTPAGGVLTGNGINGNNFNPSVAAPGNHTINYAVTIGVCFFDTDENVTVHNLPVADAGNDVSICSGDNAVIGSNPVAGYTYSWNPPAGLDNANAANPVMSLANNTTNTITQPYILTVTENGCVDDDTMTVTVFATPSAAFNATPFICENQLATIIYTGHNSTGAIYNWTFDGGNIVSGSGQGPYEISWTIPATYTVSLSVTENGCVSSIENQTVTLYVPVVDAGSDASICEAQSTQLNASGGVNYIWTPSTGLDNTNINNPTASPAATTTYYVTGTDANGCTDSDSVTVFILPVPVAAFQVENICEDELLTIEDLALPSGSISYQWNLGDGNISSVSSPTHVYNNAGNYTITQIVTLGFCSDTTSQTVTIYPKPDIRFSANKLTGIVDSTAEFIFFYEGDSLAAWSWNFGDGSFSTEMNPVHVFTDTGVYTISLSGITQYGCENSLSKNRYITIYQKPILFIPNAFTPNGDGANDVFFIYGSGIKEIHFSIFDRWGEKVFETSQFNQGWNGTINGKNAEQGVYVYEAVVITNTLEKRKLKGSITLFR
jgi:gliding motility-associated-like protein